MSFCLHCFGSFDVISAAVCQQEAWYTHFSRLDEGHWFEMCVITVASACMDHVMRSCCYKASIRFAMCLWVLCVHCTLMMTVPDFHKCFWCVPSGDICWVSLRLHTCHQFVSPKQHLLISTSGIIIMIKRTKNRLLKQKINLSFSDQSWVIPHSPARAGTAVGFKIGVLTNVTVIMDCGRTMCVIVVHAWFSMF